MLKKKPQKYSATWVYIIIFIIFFVFIYFSVKTITEKIGVKNIQKNNFKVGTTSNTDINTDVNSVINAAAPPTPVNISILPGYTLFFSSFFDSFANDYYIDASRTSLYRDNFATAFIFPPDYTWQEADAKTISSAEISSQEFTNSFDNKRCLGSNCLEQKGIELIYQGETLTLPQEIKNQKIVNVSIGALNKRWLVGVTLKNGNNYSGLVYYFDGKNFAPLLIDGKTNTISSPYQGSFGFGGEESNFLIIYGAYKGIAYHVQNNEIKDISNFFDYRMMDNGFRPEIIKVKSNQYINWYVFSLTPGKAKLIKLWQNENNEISGELVFQDIVFFGGEEVSFRLLNNNTKEVNLLARVKSGDAYSWRILSDHGFKNNTPGEVTFNPVFYDSEVIIKKLFNINLGSEKVPCPEGKIFFSQDNKNWQAVSQGLNSNQNFAPLPLNKFFLRVDFSAQKNKFYSPYLSEVLFDLYYQK